MSDWTLQHLDDLEDKAVAFGAGATQEARFANEALATQGTGLSLHRVKPGKRQAFGHVHEEAEEVYVVLSGSGRAKLDDEVVDLERLDALRVAPRVKRAFEGGPDGLEVLAFGPRHEGDGEVLPDFWPAS